MQLGKIPKLEEFQFDYEVNWWVVRAYLQVIKNNEKITITYAQSFFFDTFSFKNDYSDQFVNQISLEIMK